MERRKKRRKEERKVKRIDGWNKLDTLVDERMDGEKVGRKFRGKEGRKKGRKEGSEVGRKNERTEGK